MSLWKRIACTPEHEHLMKQYYNEKGLACVRLILASWIEETIMSTRINISNVEQVARQFYDDLKQKLLSLSSEDIEKYKLTESCGLFAQTPVVELYTYMRNGLEKEVQLLKEMPQNPYLCSPTGSVGGSVVGNGMGNGNGIAIGNSFGGVQVGDELYAAHARLQKLTLDLERARQAMQSFHADYETFHNYLNEYNQAKGLMSPQQIQERSAQMEEEYGRLLVRKNSLVIDLRHVIGEYDIIQDSVINELKKWQRNQALAGNGAQFHDNLDDIQRCIEILVDMIVKLVQYVNMMSIIKFGDNSDLTEIIAHVRYAQEVLVLSAFIVEKQPPQVMKTNTRFAAAVRWLIGPQLGINLNAPTVECIILSEAQAQRHSAQRTMGELSSSSTNTPPSSGEILNNVGTMEYQQQTRVFSASFRNMQLKKIKRAEKKGTESVMDEKFALLFYTSSVVNDYRIRVWTLSLPVVVIVHGNQEPQSWATITWDNAFSDISREPFQVPEKVSWSQLASALNMKFGSATGRSLTEENLNFLYEKLFRNECVGGDHKDYITWAQFCKEPLQDRSFTFWDWFFAIMKLTKDHLLGIWKKGLIVGFINKRKTIEDILPRTRTGTFLLRFSDSELGGITVALVNDHGQPIMLSPWTARDLNIRCLSDRVNDLSKHCHYVYPLDRPRDEAFGEFYTQRLEDQKTRDGYVVNTIRAHVPAIESDDISATTPQHYMQSPDPQNMQIGNENFNITDFDSILNY